MNIPNPRKCIYKLSCRFMVECRYSASSGTQKSLISVGVMVKTPSSSLPSTLTSYGLYSVHLRIAKGKMVHILNWLTCNQAKCLVTLMGFDWSLILHFQSHRPKLLKLLSQLQSASAVAPGHPTLPWGAFALFKPRSCASCELLYRVPSLCKECAGAGLWRVGKVYLFIFFLKLIWLSYLNCIFV